VNLLTPGRKRRKRTSAFWLWAIASVLAVGFVLVLLLR
jgi:hypothetical protein